MDKSINFEYTTRKMLDLNELELQECADLFSKNYGFYASDASPSKAGKPIKMGTGLYKKLYVRDDFYIAIAKIFGHEVAHAIYIRKKLHDNKTMTWVVQLVVDKDYRELGIASKLLHSIWGFSNDDAWGLATSNPFTVKTLEASTFRKANPVDILNHLSEIKELGDFVKFVKEYKVNDVQSVVYSDFFVDHSDVEKNIQKAFGSSQWLLGNLEPGHEWLAFTFKDQDFSSEYDKEFEKFIEFSEEQLKEAYARMNPVQPWMKHAKPEVDYILGNVKLPIGTTVLDFGCGSGRHSVEFRQNGMDVTGIDFSKNPLFVSDVNFIKADCRSYEHPLKAGLIIALYDVVGSFPDDENNQAIIKNAYKNLKSGGFFVLSVMNMELTLHLAKPDKICDVMKNHKVLQTLSASNIMQSSGDVFDPDYYVVDKQKGLVYRKEQFQNDNGLSAEYIIRDKRYTKAEICSNVEREGFEIIDARFVQAGRWHIALEPTDKKAKEILLICRKN